MRTFCFTAMLLIVSVVLAEDVAQSQPAKLPHINVDREAKVVRVDAEIADRDENWLELLACSPGTREYESVLACHAKPSHIHLALLMLGLKPGKPTMTKFDDDGKLVATKAAGPRLTVTLIYKDGEAEKRVAPNEWIVNQNDNAVMPACNWLFTGSRFLEMNGERAYAADLNGTVISIVNFGDDLIARETPMTNRDDNATWAANDKLIPAKGTKVTIEIKPAPAEKGDTQTPE